MILFDFLLGKLSTNFTIFNPEYKRSGSFFNVQASL